MGSGAWTPAARASWHSCLFGLVVVDPIEHGTDQPPPLAGLEAPSSAHEVVGDGRHRGGHVAEAERSGEISGEGGLCCRRLGLSPVDLQLQVGPCSEPVVLGHGSFRVGQRKRRVVFAQCDEEILGLLAKEIQVWVVRENTHNHSLSDLGLARGGSERW